MRSPTTIVPLLLMFLSAAALSACTTTTPTPTLRRQADRLFDRGRYADAAEKYDAIIDRYPGDWEAQHRYGRCMLEVGNISEAQRALEIAHTLEPARAEITDALADVLYRQGDRTRLFVFLRKEAESAQTPEAYLRLSQYALKVNDLDTARVAVETAIALDDGTRVGPYLVAADLAERIGDRELALRRLRQAYGINPDHQAVQQRLRALGEIPGPTVALPPGR